MTTFYITAIHENGSEINIVRHGDADLQRTTTLLRECGYHRFSITKY